METEFFPPFLKHALFPQLCDGVSLRYESRRGCYVVAERDIPCGEVVCLDVGKVVNLDESLCCYCLKSLPEDWNKQYCDTCLEQHKFYAPVELMFVERLKALGMFRLAVHLALSYPCDEILSCLEDSRPRKDVFDSSGMSSDTLAAALSLQVGEYPVDLSAADDLVKDIVAELDKHFSWKLVPQTCRFVAFQTLLKMISSRLMTNAHCIYFVDCLERNSEGSLTPTPVPSAVGLFPAACWFNHSCRANLSSFFYGNKLVFVSMGIRRGEEICDNYGASFFRKTKRERADFLAGRGFTCNCTVCLSNDSIDHMLEPVIEHPDLILKSLPNVEDYKQYRNALPDGHKIIEFIAEMYVGSRGGDDPEKRLFLYGEIIECQRKRGLHFSPEQIRTLLNCAVACYDAACRSKFKNPKFMDCMQVHLFAALVRMRTFYGKLYPAYEAAKSLADEVIQMEGTESRGNFADAVEKLRAILESLKPALPKLE